MHFLADARDVDRRPILARPGAGDAQPAGAVFVVLAVAVPVELHFDAPVLVREDFLAGGADDRGGLDAIDQRVGREPRRARQASAVGKHSNEFAYWYPLSPPER